MDTTNEIISGNIPDIQLQNSLSESHQNIFMKYSIIIAILLFLLAVWMGFSWKFFFDWKNETVVIAPENTNNTWSVEQTWSIEKDSRDRSVTNDLDEREIYSLVERFSAEFQSGSFSVALDLYQKILESSNYHPIFTGEEEMDPVKRDALLAIESNISKENDPTKKSDYLVEKGSLEYEIWNDFYYWNPEKYWLVVYYYYMRAINSFDESIVLSDNALAHRNKWIVILDLGSPLANTAIQELKVSIELDPTDSRSFYKLWNAQGGIKEYNLAIASYLSGLSIEPDNELLKNNLWLAYLKLWQKDEWLRVLNDLILTCKNYCNIANYNYADELLKQDWRKNYQLIWGLFGIAIEKAKLKNETYRDAYRQKWKILYEEWKISYQTSIQDYNAKLFEANKQFIISLNDPNDKKTGVNIFNQNNDEEGTYYYIVKIYKELWAMNLAEKYLKLGLTKFPKNKDLLDLKE